VVDPLVKFVPYEDQGGMWRGGQAVTRRRKLENRLVSLKKWRGPGRQAEMTSRFQDQNLFYAAGFIGETSNEGAQMAVGNLTLPVSDFMKLVYAF
jgi:hypothetical protein